MRGMIAAVSPEGVIGLHNRVPWNHPGDMKRFARVTRGSTVIMGRLTWESMNRKPLPNRRNVVIARQPVADVESYRDIAAALASSDEAEDVWFIGGARIYAEAMPFCDVIDLTYVPDHVTAEGAVHFPAIDESVWEAGPIVAHEDEVGLSRRVFTRRAPARIA